MKRMILSILLTMLLSVGVKAGEMCEWAGEYFFPGETIRPDLWCILTCEPSGDWRADCDGGLNLQGKSF